MPRAHPPGVRSKQLFKTSLETHINIHRNRIAPRRVDASNQILHFPDLNPPAYRMLPKLSELIRGRLIPRI